VLSETVSYEKFHDAAFFAREIDDDCLQVRISKNIRLIVVMIVHLPVWHCTRTRFAILVSCSD